MLHQKLKLNQQFVFLILLALLGYSVCGNAQANYNCRTIRANMVECDLLPTRYLKNKPMVLGATPGQAFRLINRTGRFLQINQVTAFTGETKYWSEFCVFKNRFAISQPVRPGEGEVGCTHKAAGESYLPVRWDGKTTALSVEPGATIILHSNSPGNEYVSHQYKVWAYPQVSGVHAYRSPQYDKVITCNGKTQFTEWTPWRNNTGRIQHVNGATLYSVNGFEDTVGVGCIYILSANNSVRYKNCHPNLRKRGVHKFPVQKIFPGESIVGQAANSCIKGRLWDWAAYMHVW